MSDDFVVTLAPTQDVRVAQPSDDVAVAINEDGFVVAAISEDLTIERQSEEVQVSPLTDDLVVAVGMNDPGPPGPDIDIPSLAVLFENGLV